MTKPRQKGNALAGTIEPVTKTDGQGVEGGGVEADVWAALQAAERAGNASLIHYYTGLLLELGADPEDYRDQDKY
jgi:hypothetical protein